MTPDEKLLRDEIAKKEGELEQLKEDLRMLAENRRMMHHRIKRPLGIDLSLLQDDGK